MHSTHYGQEEKYTDLRVLEYNRITVTVDKMSSYTGAKIKEPYGLLD